MTKTSEDGSSGSESSPEGASFEYVKDLVLKAGSSSYTPLTPIPLASISVDPTSQSFGEGTQASRTVTPTSAFKSSDFPQVIPLSLNLTTPFFIISRLTCFFSLSHNWVPQLLPGVALRGLQSVLYLAP